MRRKSWSLLLVVLLLGLAGVSQATPLVNCQVDLDRRVLLAGPTQKTIIKIALDAPLMLRTDERSPVNLALVLDRSGSMSGDKITKAREAAIEALRRLGSSDLFALVAYNHEVKTLVPAQRVQHSEGIEALIRRIQPGGNTALFGAISQGAAEVRKHSDSNYVHRVVLLSDGLANVGPSNPADLARLGAALLKEGISVTTVGVGTDFNEDLMSQLAERSDGNHYFVESSRDLSRIFAAELGDVLSVVARKVIIEIECPPGVKPLRIIGREGRIKGQKVEVRMNQIYGGQQKYALVEVEVPVSVPGQQLDLARVDCRYQNALTDIDESSTTLARTRFSQRPQEVRQAASKAVQKVVVENEMAVTRDQALNLYNAGRKGEAARVLREKSDDLKEQNAALGFADLAEEAGQLQDEATEFETEQLDKTRKKELRSESFKVRKQQKAY
jgi:Ca-activated chloride channel family protein